MKNTLAFVALFVIAAAAFAVAPPSLINYQGVLRNSAGAPLNGTFDITFRFYDAAALGNQILIDSHTVALSTPVTVAGGLFNVALGSGFVSDGSGPGTYVSLAAVFRDHGAAWVEVVVGSEVLAPRVRVISAAYSLNADTLDGLDSTAFAGAAHAHAGEDITSGTVADARIASTIARDAEVMPIVLASDGTGSTLDADLLDGLDSTAFSQTAHNHDSRYLRKDVADTANGAITFNQMTAFNQPIGVGVAPDSDYSIRTQGARGGGHFEGTKYGSLNLVNQTSTDTLFGVYAHARNYDTGTGDLYGSYNWVFAGGASNAKTVYGLVGEAIGVGTSTGDHYGVHGRATANTGGVGTHYGVYGEASGGAVNWGLYTPNNAFVGGLLDFGAEANDHLNAAIITDLTDGDETTLHHHNSANDSRYLRKDVADTANGAITFNQMTAFNAPIGVGAAPDSAYSIRAEGATYGGRFRGTQYGSQSFVGQTSTSTLYGAYNHAQNSDTGSGELYGSYNLGSAFGTSNAKTVYGLFGAASGVSTSTGSHYGVYGQAITNTGGVGTHYGVYGEAGSGAVNWGLYTPNNAFVGGLLDFGAGANDHLNAAIITDLTDGGDTTLHHHNSANDLRYLRKDVDDTAAGSITFNQPIGVGGAPSSFYSIRTQGASYGGYFEGTQYGSRNQVNQTSTFTLYGAYNFAQNNDTGTGDLQGSLNWGYAAGASNAKTVYGLRALADGVGTSTGSHYGVYGQATANTGGVGTHYGVYGTASGGATNWGLYTPGNAFVGGLFQVNGNTTLGDATSDTLTVNARVSGNLDFGAGANDHLNATIITDLTDGGDTTLHHHNSANDSRYLRKDVNDTAAGNITFNGRIGVAGGAPVSYAGINNVFNTSTGTSTSGEIINHTNTSSSSGLTARGLDVQSNVSASGTSNSSIGLDVRATGASDGTGIRWGVYSTASGGTGTHYGVYGSASTASGSGTHYGVYGEAAGGATNWGLYTPNNANLGTSTANLHRWSGTFQSATGNFDHKILPGTANWGQVGDGTYYWTRMYAGSYYGKSTSITAFDIYPDLDLLDAMQMTPHTDPKTGKTSLIFTNLPPMILGDPATDGEGAEEFVDVMKAIGFAFGSLRQMRGEVKGYDAALRDELDLRTPDKKTGKQTMDGNLQIVLDKDASGAGRFSVFGEGQGGLAQELMRVDEAGNLRLKGALMPNSLDLAEFHPVSEAVEPGDVLVADRFAPGMMRRSSFAEDKAVVGIVSTSPGVALGAGVQRLAALEPELAARIDAARARGDKAGEDALWARMERRFTETHAALALSGTVLCKVDAGYGAVEVGDLLVASHTPGHAMRSDDPKAGTIIGKALEPLDAGTGLVKVLVMLR